jgi:peptidoglycan/LPS O-acetylase OafA/YrhL
MPSSARNTSRVPSYFGWIDALRGVAAICVVIFHYHHFYLAEYDVLASVRTTADFPYGAILGVVYDLGEEAVRLFWVISGFVFAHVYWSRDTTARDFAIARIARLYPLHFVTLLFVAILQIVSTTFAGHVQIFGNNDGWQFAQQVFLLNHVLGFAGEPSFNGPIWLVSAELFAYAVFLATLTLTKRNPLIGSLLLAVVSYVALSLHPDGFVIGQWALVCLVFFFAGSTCFAVYQQVHDKTAVMVATILALLGVAWVGHVTDSNNTVLLSLCCAIVLIVACMENVTTHVGRGGRFLGDISYSIYLVHVPIQMVILLLADLFFDATRSFADSYVTLPAYLIVSIWCAYVVNVRFEKPIGLWVRRRMRGAANVTG